MNTWYLVCIIIGVILSNMTRLLHTSRARRWFLWIESISSAGGTRFENRPPATLPRLALAPRGRPVLLIGLCLCVGAFSCVFICVYVCTAVVWLSVCVYLKLRAAMSLSFFFPSKNNKSMGQVQFARIRWVFGIVWSVVCAWNETNSPPHIRCCVFFSAKLSKNKKIAWREASRRDLFKPVSNIKKKPPTFVHKEPNKITEKSTDLRKSRQQNIKPKVIHTKDPPETEI